MQRCIGLLVLCCIGGSILGENSALGGKSSPQTRDSGETRNVAANEQRRVEEMAMQYKTLSSHGRSTTGPKQQNDVPVKVYPAS